MCLTYLDGASVQVWVYSNGDEMELFLNGESLGATPLPTWDKGTFTVVYEPGNLTAVVRKDGKLWARDTIMTAAAPKKIKLELDPLMAANVLMANGQDATLLTARLVF